MAEHDKILVFRPYFPTQRLSELLYKWRLPVSVSNLQGYLDPRHPHAVNSLLIAKLGTQEVLVCACDDGDVILYYTHFLQEISITKDYKFDADYHLNARPLMIGNVRQSAWGLAIHTNARILAVSCNTHDVSVFKFALTDDAVLYNDPQKEWQYPGRSKDDLHVFASHRTNIPNISFFNSDLDKEGRYLVSTDLTGAIVLWDLRECSQIKRIDPPSTPDGTSGWSIACIDPRAFLLIKSDLEFLGCKLERNRNGTYDATQCRFNLKDSSVYYQGARVNSADSLFSDIARQSVATARRSLLRAQEIQEQMDRLEASMERANAAFDQMERRHTTALQALSERNNSDRTFTNDGLDGDEDDDIEDRNSEDDMDEEPGDMNLDGDQILGSLERSSRESLTHIQTTESLNASLFMAEDSDDSAPDTYVEEFDMLGVIPTSEDISNHSLNIGSTNSSLYTMSARRDPSYTHFLIIHTGQNFVSLQEAPFDNLAVISRDPCHQHLPTNMAWLSHYDRLHLSQLIPELNVFVAATAAGRAAIYTLTRKVTSTKSAMNDEYGIRLEVVLPFTSQEERKERPATLLIGLAAAPIQGHHSNFGNGQRWRLVLTYHDHTVMNYELWRDGGYCSVNAFI